MSRSSIRDTALGGGAAGIGGGGDLGRDFDRVLVLLEREDLKLTPAFVRRLRVVRLREERLIEGVGVAADATLGC